MEEQIMRVERADIRNNDHGGAVIEIDLISQSTGQGFICPVDPDLAYKLLNLFGVEYLSDARGKAVAVLRNEPGGLIQGLRSLPCDPWLEVMRS